MVRVVGASSRTADCEARVSEAESERVNRFFSAPPVYSRGSSVVTSLSASSSSPPSLGQEKQSRKGGDEDDRREYYVNTGYAIRTLREEYPEMFHREPTFDIYREG
ncbi:hypothetical protein QJS10_CPA03g00263 [Acorus calamus]|uniref:Uncharacterized protein n=1 Tax=Acorus calamus TaxID=4465 RepID=A0AAV9F3L9_ACOCL|nr:hypothetical protein QJS10_CPA03g00263 [Acorus calamus]